MSSTILETLQNAKFNLIDQRISGFSDKIGAQQLNNAISLLEKGYGAHDDVEAIVNLHGSIENVPYKEHLLAT